MAKNLALSLRKWHKKNLIGENGGERKINPSANPDEGLNGILIKSLISKMWAKKSLISQI